MGEVLTLLLPAPLFLGAGAGLLARSVYVAAVTAWLVLAAEIVVVVWVIATH